MGKSIRGDDQHPPHDGLLLCVPRVELASSSCSCSRLLVVSLLVFAFRHVYIYLFCHVFVGPSGPALPRKLLSCWVGFWLELGRALPSRVRVVSAARLQPPFLSSAPWSLRGRPDRSGSIRSNRPSVPLSLVHTSPMMTHVYSIMTMTAWRARVRH